MLKVLTKFQTIVGFSLWSCSILVKYEVRHGQLQPPNLSQCGSTKGSTNKVTVAQDIPDFMRICFVYGTIKIRVPNEHK